MRIPLRIKMRFTYRLYRHGPGFALTVLFVFVGFTWLYKYHDWMFGDGSLNDPPLSLYSGLYLLWIPIKLLEGNTLPCIGYRWRVK